MSTAAFIHEKCDDTLLNFRTPSKRKLENAAAWVTVGLAWFAIGLGLMAPLLGGSNPGLQGLTGFISETVATLLVQGGMLTAIVAVVAVLRHHWWQAAALAPIALISLAPAIWAEFHSPVSYSPSDGPAMRIATVNLAEQNREDPLMEGSLRQLDADVLVLPEFTASWAEHLEGWLADDYPYRWLGTVETPSGYSAEGFRLAIWSRLPPAGEPAVLSLGGCNPQIRVPLLWHGRAFALYGIHPRAPYPYMRYAESWCDRQQLLDWIRDETLPTVVAGDFNATPRSAFISRLQQLGLTNASETVCGHAPVTWPMYRPAPLRIAIDHVMHSDAFRALSFERGPTTNSDHAPIIAELSWQPL